MTASPRLRRSVADWLPRHRGWWLIGGAFAAGLLLFLLVWAGKRNEFDFYRAQGMPHAVDGQSLEPLPVPMAAGDAPASGMDDSDPPPAGTARIDSQAPAPPAPASPSSQMPGDPPASPSPSTAAGASATLPRLVHAPPPEYPRSALRAGISGDVVIRIDVGPDGIPASLEIVKSSRNRDLDRAAMQAVRQWRFQPAISNGVPVAASVQQRVTFGAPD